MMVPQHACACAPSCRRGNLALEPRSPGSAAAVVALLAVIVFAMADTRLAWPGSRQLQAPPDTAGTALVEWAYDSWTVPWVQVKGSSAVLAPASHATFMALACQTADLERDRLARHLSQEDCEHRMAAIRADQDSALIFRLDLRAFDFPGASGLVRLDARTSVTLEDDRRGRWTPLEVRRGPAVLVATGLKLKRIYYRPPWLRGSENLYPDRFDAGSGRSLTVAEHTVRFARRDALTGESIVNSRTRWIRLRLSGPRHGWVATWTFRPDEAMSP